MAQSQFINPYNFIPLQDESPDRGRLSDIVKKGDLTGVIHISLRTRTPLIIPNTSNDDAFAIKYIDKKGNTVKHKSYDFFSYDDLAIRNNLNKKRTRDDMFSEPVIPGSEVRGMLRSYYEVLTNSCMSFVDDKDILSKRTNEAFQPALLECKGKNIYLYEGIDCVLYDRKITQELRDCQEVYFDIREAGKVIKAINVSTKKKGEKHVGYVIKGEPGPKKKNDQCHILMMKVSPKNKGRKLSDEEKETLKLVLDSYNGVSRRLSKQKAQKKYKDYAAEWYRFSRGNGHRYFPVRYSIAAENFVMLSPACITREIYKNRLSDLIGDHSSCKDTTNICPACALFGMLEGRNHAASRIRVSDMRLTKTSLEKHDNKLSRLYYDKVTLKPLNSPKVNNMEFYLRKPAEDAWFWTYDYYIDSEGRIHSCSPVINGRKFYWHQPEMKVNSNTTNPSNLNATFRPLREGVEFEGEIYFEHLSSKELDKLIYAINAGESSALATKNHCHKLGHAKPFGYGSVAINVDDVELRKISMDDESGTVNYSKEPYKSYPPEVSAQAVKSLETVTDFNKLLGKSRMIHYPIPDIGDAKNRKPIYKWFVDNHGAYDREENKIIGMPNSRIQMTYIEHMYALEPELKETGAPPKYKEKQEE